jgi:hypothetical protein
VYVTANLAVKQEPFFSDHWFMSGKSPKKTKGRVEPKFLDPTYGWGQEAVGIETEGSGRDKSVFFAGPQPHASPSGEAGADFKWDLKHFSKVSLPCDYVLA